MAMRELREIPDEQRERLRRYDMEPRWKKTLRRLYDAVRGRAHVLFEAIVHGHDYYKFEMKMRRASSDGRRDFYHDRRIIR